MLNSRNVLNMTLVFVVLTVLTGLLLPGFYNTEPIQAAPLVADPAGIAARPIPPLSTPAPVLARGGTLEELWQYDLGYTTMPEQIPGGPYTPTIDISTLSYINGDLYVFSGSNYRRLSSGSTYFDVTGTLEELWGSEVNHPPTNSVDTVTTDGINGNLIVTQGDHCWFKSITASTWTSKSLSSMWITYTVHPPLTGIDTQIFYPDGHSLVTKGEDYWFLPKDASTFFQGKLSDLWKNGFAGYPWPGPVDYIHPKTDGIDIHTFDFTTNREWVIKGDQYWVMDAAGKTARTWKSGHDYLGQREPFIMYRSGKYYLFYDGQELGDDGKVTNTPMLAISSAPDQGFVKQQVEIQGETHCWESFALGSPAIFEDLTVPIDSPQRYVMVYLASSGVVPDCPTNSQGQCIGPEGIFNVGSMYTTGMAVSDKLEGPWTKVDRNHQPILPLGGSTRVPEACRIPASTPPPTPTPLAVLGDGAWDENFNSSFATILKVQPGWGLDVTDGYVMLYTGHGNPPEGFGVGLAHAITTTGPYTKINPNMITDTTPRRNVILPPEEYLENATVVRYQSHGLDSDIDTWFMFGNQLSIHHACEATEVKGCNCRGGQGVMVYRTPENNPLEWQKDGRYIKLQLVAADPDCPVPASPTRIDYNNPNPAYHGHVGVPSALFQGEQFYLYYDANAFVTGDDARINHFFRDIYMVTMPVADLLAQTGDLVQAGYWKYQGGSNGWKMVYSGDLTSWMPFVATQPVSGLNVVGPCNGKAYGQCAFETRSMAPLAIGSSPITQVDSITAYGQRWDYRMSDYKLLRYSDLSTSPYNDSNGPCYGKSAGQCHFDSRTFITLTVSGIPRLIESITADGYYWNYFADTGQLWASGSLAVAHYAAENGPCYQNPGSCRFDTRTSGRFTISNVSRLVDSITVGNNYWNYYLGDDNQWHPWGTVPGTLTNRTSYTNTFGVCYGRDENNPCLFGTREIITLNSGQYDLITTNPIP